MGTAESILDLSGKKGERPEKAGEPRQASLAHLSSGPPSASQPGSETGGTLEAGTVIADRYRIEALLGEGGMGKVYRAEHVHMRKQVAVKVLHGDVSTTPEITARFEREAVAVGKISHPNVAAATDFGRLEDGSFFLVLEYVPGRDLRTVIREGRVPELRAVRIVQQIAAAVGAAHAAGIIHRDLKPENIMLCDRDEEEDFVKVLDFGIAKFESVGIVDGAADTQSLTSGPQPLTRLGAVFGTPDYMSPEQALGQPIDPRTDLYAIGVMLFELLSGERPFRGGAVTLMRQHVLQDAPPLPAAVAEVVDPRIPPIIDRLLQKSPQDRYANAAELVVALGEVANLSPLGASSPSVLGRSAFVSSPNVSRSSMASYESTPAPPLAPSLAPSLAQGERKSGSKFWLFVLVVVGVGGYVWGSGKYLSFLQMVRKVPSTLSSTTLSAASEASPSQSSQGPLARSGIEKGIEKDTPGGLASALVEPGTDGGPLGSAAASSDDSASAAPSSSSLPDETEEDDTSAPSADRPTAAGAGPAQRHTSAPKPTRGKKRAAPRSPKHGSGSNGGLHIPPPNQWFK